MKLTGAKPKGRSKTYPKYWCCNKGCKNRFSVRVEKIEADWLQFLEDLQPTFDALVNVIPVLGKANASKQIENTEHRQRQLATQLADKQAVRVKLITAKLNGQLNQEDFDIMRDAVVKDIEEIQAAQRAMAAEAELYLHLTVDTTRLSVPARAMWIAAPLNSKRCNLCSSKVFAAARILASLHQSRMNWKRLYSIAFWNLQRTKMNGGPGWT